MISKILSAPDLFTRCMSIASPDFFDPEVKPIVRFVKKYYDQYNAPPKLEYVNAECDTDFKESKLDKHEIKFITDEFETFCRHEALFIAITSSAADIVAGNKENIAKIQDKIQDALAISIQKELGIEMFTDIRERLEKYLTTAVYEPTGIKGLDDALGGGLARKQVTMFSANSGGGKSIMMSNIGANYARRGFHVLQLALELTDEMIDLRNLSIMTGTKTDSWKRNITEIVNLMEQHKEAGAGSFIVKRIPGGSTALHIRSYLKLYEAEYGHAPDVLIVDYLDLMHPNGGVSGKGVFEQDKEKSEQLTEIAFDYDCIVLTASQQNRDGVRTATPDQAIIAGGISKINTVDNYISIYMNPEMRLKGEMFIYYLKTRSSSAVGTMTALTFNPDNLIISDKRIEIVSVMQAIKNRAKKKKDAEDAPLIFPGETADSTTIIPSEFADIIEQYHKEDEDMRAYYDSLNKPPELDIADDKSLWEPVKKKKFKIRYDDDETQYESHL